MKKLKLVEDGYDYSPACTVFKEDEWKPILKMESTVMRPGSYLTISKSQARKLAKFLLEFADDKEGGNNK